MSDFSSDMEAAVQFCTSLISCSHCGSTARGGEGEDVRRCVACSQLFCSDCSATSHSCLLSADSSASSLTTSPCHSFLSQLCVQLTSIAHCQRRFETVERLKSAREMHSKSGRGHQQLTGNSSRRQRTSRLQSAAAAPALNGTTTSRQTDKPVRGEDGEEDSSTRRRKGGGGRQRPLSEQTAVAAGISPPTTTLDCIDNSLSQESNSHLLTGSFTSSSSSSSADSQRPNKETDETNTSLSNNKKSSSSSSSNWQSYSMRNNNLIKSPKNKKRSNMKRKKKITGIYLYDLKNNSLNGSYDDEKLDFRGFRDSEIDSIFIQILRRNMILNKSSLETYTSSAAGLEISLRQLYPSELTAALLPRSPSSSLGCLGVISPVSRGEEERANASHHLDRSVLDLGSSPQFSTPVSASPPVRSKRHLAFDSPQQQQQLLYGGMNLSPIPEAAEAAEISGGAKKKLRLLLDGSGLESVKREREETGEERGGELTNGGPAGGDSASSESCEDTIQAMLNKLIYKEDRRKAEGNSETRGLTETVCLSTCGLSGRQQTDVARLARLTHSRLTNCFSHETTHLVLDETSIGCTEYLFAIVYRAIIVSYDWVTLCLAERRILSPMGFIPKSEEGPCRCLETDCEPFQGFYFFMGLAPSHPSHLDYAAYHVTKTLISHGGGKIIQDQEGFLPLVSVESIKPRFYISIESEISEATGGVCEGLEAVAVKHTWISDSVRAYRALPIADYLYTTPRVYSRSQLASRYRLPSELLTSQPAAAATS